MFSPAGATQQYRMAKNPAFEREMEIASALKGIHFPANRDDLVKHAEQLGAPAQVCDMLRKARSGEFHNVAEVMEATKA
jgi:hypothetical protein